MRIAIVGGGITGLAAAWELQQHGVPYVLLEASGHLGGKLVTLRTGQFVIEAGPDSFLARKPWACVLADEVGLTAQLQGTNSQQRGVFVWRAGRLHPYPTGLRLIVPVEESGLRSSALLSPGGIERMLAEPGIPPRCEQDDESLASFVRRRYGQEALEVFGDSLLAGIHAGNPEEMSIQATFPEFVELERRYGSVTLGMRQRMREEPARSPSGSAFMAPREGIEELARAVAARLTGEVHTAASVSRIAADHSVLLSTGKLVPADAVLVTTPASVAAGLLVEVAPQAAEALQTFDSVSSATVSLAFKRDELEHALDGYGFVIPRSEPTRITACTWSSTKLAHRAPADQVLLRVFFGGFDREGDVEEEDQTLVAWARSDLELTMGVRAAPVLTRVFRWRRANPQYSVGHLSRVEQIRADCPPWLSVAGAALDGVGIPDCIRQGREAARRLLEQQG